jgi:hypothetical protein
MKKDFGKIYILSPNAPRNNDAYYNTPHRSLGKIGRMD